MFFRTLDLTPESKSSENLSQPLPSMTSYSGKWRVGGATIFSRLWDSKNFQGFLKSSQKTPKKLLKCSVFILNSQKASMKVSHISQKALNELLKSYQIYSKNSQKRSWKARQMLLKIMFLKNSQKICFISFLKPELHPLNPTLLDTCLHSPSNDAIFGKMSKLWDLENIRALPIYVGCETWKNSELLLQADFKNLKKAPESGKESSKDFSKISKEISHKALKKLSKNSHRATKKLQNLPKDFQGLQNAPQNLLKCFQRAFENRLWGSQNISQKILKKRS